jgi:SAM-dependent methyltransferase
MDATFEASYHAAEDANWWFLARRDMVRRLLVDVGVPRDAAIVDIGCAGGASLDDLARHGYTDVTGADMSAAAVERCRMRGKKAVVADATSLPFGDQSVDLVIASDILEHVSDDAAALREWRRVLKPGGLALIFVPAHPFLWSAHDDVNHHVRRYRKAGFVERLSEAGFRIERVSFWNVALFFPTWLVRVLMNIFKRSDRSPSVAMPQPIINRTLTAWLTMENALLTDIGSPVGVSLFAIVKKTV